VTKEQKMVREFRTMFEQTVNRVPTVVSKEDRKLVLCLIYEEFLELCDAVGAVTNLPPEFEIIAEDVTDLERTADALTDLDYVVKGGLVCYGMDGEPLFAEIHRSNMTKIGGHKNAHGKWIKPETYSPAKLKPLLLEQGADI